MKVCQDQFRYGHEESFKVMETLGERLRVLRLERNMSQADLARKSGLDPSHISRIESDEFAFPRQPTLESLARAMNCDLSELIEMSSTRTPTPYDRDPVYREIVDRLDSLTPSLRDRAVHLCIEILRFATDADKETLSSATLSERSPKGGRDLGWFAGDEELDSGSKHRRDRTAGDSDRRDEEK